MTDAPPRSPTTPARSPHADERTIRPRRSLPGGRAVVGAFLVVAAAVGTFGAYLNATATPSTSYLVATRSFQLGHVITEEDLVDGGDAGVVGLAIDLPERVAAAAYPSDRTSAQQLVGQVVVAPITADDLLLASQFAEVTTAAGGVVLSFSLPTERALAGRLEAGEIVDLVATFPGAGAAQTQTLVVARGITVVGATTTGDGINGGRVLVTVDVEDLPTAQAVQHAVDVAQVAVLRGADPADASPPATTGPGPSGVTTGSDGTADGEAITVSNGEEGR